jgi:hypothetical protein
VGLLFSTEQYTRLHVYILYTVHIGTDACILHTSTDGIKERHEYTRVLTCIALSNLSQDVVEYKCYIPASESKSSRTRHVLCGFHHSAILPPAPLL